MSKRDVTGAKRVLFMSSYSMREAYARFKAGTMQEHHLWGLTRLSPNFDVEYGGSYSRTGFEKRLGKIGLKIFNIRTQLRTFFTIRDAIDVAYFGTYNAFFLQGLLAKIFKRRIKTVCLLHFPVSKVNKIFLDRFDLVLTLAKNTQDYCEAVLGLKNSKYIGWAVDRNFYNFVPANEDGDLYVFSAGKDRRDYPTFVAGMAQSGSVGYHAKIYTSADFVMPSSANIDVISGGIDQNAATEEMLADELARCSVVAIPLKSDKRVAGLTSVLDAFGAGRFLLCTRNDGLDFDIEALGIGRWIEPGDVNGWREAVSWSINNRQALSTGGIAARKYCELELDLSDYGARLEAALTSVVK